MFTDHPKIIDHCLNHSQPLNLESYTKGVAEAKRVAAENANAAKKKKKRVGSSHTSSSAPAVRSSAPAVSSSEKTMAGTTTECPIIGSAPPSSAAPSARLSLVRVGPNNWRGEVDGKYLGHFATESSGRCAFNAYEIEEAARKKRKKQQSLIEASAASSAEIEEAVSRMVQQSLIEVGVGRLQVNAYEIEEAARKKRKKQQSLIEASAASSADAAAARKKKKLKKGQYEVVVKAAKRHTLGLTVDDVATAKHSSKLILTDIAGDSLAKKRCAALRVNDAILEINGVDVRHVSFQYARDILVSAARPISIVFQSSK